MKWNHSNLHVWQTCSFCWCTGKLLALMFSIPPPEKHSMSWEEDRTKASYRENTLSKMSVVLLKLAQLLIPLHGLKHRLVWFTEHDVSRTTCITTLPDIFNKVWPLPSESSFFGYSIDLPSIPLVVKRPYEGTFFQ